MERRLHDLVRERARRCCEYCHLPESLAKLPFHVDHVVARQHGGETTLENLAFVCCYCNRYKGPNVAGVDPQSRRIVELFDPRRHVWDEHFGWQGPRLFGKTPVGRATIQSLRINRAVAVETRELLMREGVFDVDLGRIHDGASDGRRRLRYVQRPEAYQAADPTGEEFIEARMRVEAGVQDEPTRRATQH